MPVRYRISALTAAFILTATLGVDLLQIFLTMTIVGSVVCMLLGTLLGIILWVTYTIHGVKYSGTAGLKKIAATFGTMALEMLPFLDALPLVSIGAVIIILQTRSEDRETAQKEAQEQMAAQQQQAASAQEMAQAQRIAQDMMASRSNDDEPGAERLSEAA